MLNIFTMSLGLMADSSGAIFAMRDYVAPTMQGFTALAAIASTFFLVHGGILYMTSRGNPDKLEQAKRVLRNALVGLVIVLGAATLTAILNGAIVHTATPINATLPNLQAIEPKPSNSGLIDVLINAVTGFLNVIIQAVATPFLAALDFFTKSTPLMSDNASVFNLWLAMVGITDALFVVIIALLGFHVMSAATFGLDEIEFKHLLPRIGLIFLLLNTSIFLIDGIIGLSNALIIAVGKVGGTESVWQVLTTVVNQSGGQGVAALLIMSVFLIFTVILLVYYVGRLVTLFIGAVLSPLIFLVWLVPGFRDFSETAMKSYVSTTFVLFVHVVILQLAASLFAGMSMTTGNNVPNTLIAMVVGLATVIALLKTQGVMMQFSYVSLGPRSMRQLGSQFMNGVSYMGGKGKSVVSGATSKVSSRSATSKTASSSRSTSSSSYKRPQTGPTPTVTVTRNRAPTGQTSRAPMVASEKPRATVHQLPTRQSHSSRSSTKEDNAT
jgi:hypothetical protein